MKKLDIALSIVCLFAFVYTSVWVHVFLRSRAEATRGEQLVASIPTHYRSYAKLLPRQKAGVLSEAEKKAFEQVRYDYYQSVVKAITAFDNCLHSYTPFNKYLPVAADALMRIGDDCLNKNEFSLALSAYRTIRISPDPSWVSSAEKKIKDTYAKMERLKARDEKAK
ncbi:MAG: hypothetical protein DRH70_06115 [Candidatus Coatesbacteria bacterium]|nr:MAG: hypothetical protein DRH70_06115 [Candidatus Coatesbacteria bacterium]